MRQNATASNTRCRTTKLSNSTRKRVALSAASNKSTVTALARQHGVSRTTVRNARDKAVDAVNEAFDSPNNDVLFYLPVTRKWLHSLVLALMLVGGVSYRAIMTLLQDLFDTRLCLGTIHNIFCRAAERAHKINQSIDLSNITNFCADEFYHRGKPVINAMDASSLYCCSLSIENQRDGETWAVHLLDAKEQGLLPKVMISDQAEGIVSAQKTVFSYCEHRYDNFHLSRSLMDLRRFYRNRLRTSITERKSAQKKIYDGVVLPQDALSLAIEAEKQADHISKTIDTLISWLEHDVLNKPGLPHRDRELMYDFIVQEFRRLEKIEPHRISAVRVTLENKKIDSLSFIKEIETRFEDIALAHHIPVDWVWEMAQLQRCDFLGDAYAVQMLPLCTKLGERFEDVEDDVLLALDSTERTSSLMENLNGRVKRYNRDRGFVTNHYLGLLRFYLNHTPFRRSARVSRKGKTPRAIMTEKSHDHWLELLGFDRFKRTA